MGREPANLLDKLISQTVSHSVKLTLLTESLRKSVTAPVRQDKRSDSVIPRQNDRLQLSA